jgi:hypothetical protein
MEPGIHEWDADYYHSDPCPTPSLSASIITVMCQKSPLHAWTAHPRLNPGYAREESDAFDLGTIAHALVLEGTDMAVVVNANDWRTNEAKARRAAIRAQGKIPILAHKMPELEAMIDAIEPQLNHHEAVGMFKAGLPEQSIVWQENGVYCRARLDWLRADYKAIDDYKTTSGTANPEIVSRGMATFGYDIQAAFYLRGVKAVTGVDAVFRFCIQETAKPYALSVVSLAPDMLNLADRKIEWAVNKWRACLESGVWPGYPAKVCYANLSPYAEADWMEAELMRS